MSGAVPKGTTALIGQNGSGKTTLLRILAGIYLDYQGSAKLGGGELRDLDVQVIRRAVGAIPQNTYLFEGTLRENLMAARPEATATELEQAINLARMDSLLNRFALGLDHPVFAGGANLSGGERAKVACAQLFLRRPGIVLLDEASSGLDVESESQVLRNIRQEFAGSMIVFATHRLNNIDVFDHIVVMNEGRIAEIGSHHDLIAAGGLYSRLMGVYHSTTESIS